MAIDFPSSPTTGQIHQGFIWSGVAWNRVPINTALPKNFLVNPAMQVSQERGTTAGTSYPWFAADQWVYSGAGTGWLVSFASAASTSDLYVPALLSMLSTGTRAAPTGADTLTINQPIEGVRTCDFLWGTSSARQLVLRFTAHVTGTASFTLCVHFRNAATDRSYVIPVTLSNTPTVYTYSIPGCTDSTWLIDNGRGLNFGFCVAAGSTLHAATPLTWVTGNFTATSAISNICSATSQNVFLGRIGLYADPYRTGVAPPFEIPEITAETKRCQRYWYKAYGLHGGVASGTAVSRSGMRHPVPMRVTPSASAVGAIKFYDGAVAPAFSSISANTSNYWAAELDIATGGTFATGGKQACMYYQTDADYFAMNARM